MLVANVATSAGFWLLRSVQVRSQIARPPAHCLQDGHRGHTSPLDIVDIVDIVDTPRHPPVDTKCGEDGGGDVPPPRDHDGSLRGGVQQQQQRRALPGDAAAAGEAQQEHEAEVQVSTVQHSTVQYRLCTVQYRSIGIMDDFSGIVTNMIGSLQEVQVDIVVSIQQFLIMSLNISVKRRSHGQEN